MRWVSEQKQVEERAREKGRKRLVSAIRGQGCWLLSQKTCFVGEGGKKTMRWCTLQSDGWREKGEGR